MLFSPTVGILQLPRSEAREGEAGEECSRKEQSVTSGLEPSSEDQLGWGVGAGDDFLCAQKVPGKDELGGWGPWSSNAIHFWSVAPVYWQSALLTN